MYKILIGFLSGIISGTGMGGGTVLIFLLTYGLGVEQRVSQAANLIFFIPTSIMAIIVNFKNKNVDISIAIAITLFGIFGAIIGAKISINVNVLILKKWFGIFLIFIAINEIYTIYKLYLKKNKICKKKNNKLRGN